MRNRIMVSDVGEARLLDTDQLRAYMGIGRNNAMKIGAEIGARVQVGRRVLWDKRKVDAYIDSLTGM